MRLTRPAPGRGGLGAVCAALVVAATACGGDQGRVEVVDAAPEGSSAPTEVVTGTRLEARSPMPGAGPAGSGALDDACSWLDPDASAAVGARGAPDEVVEDHQVVCTWDGDVELLAVPTAGLAAAMERLSAWQAEVRLLRTLDDVGRAAVVALVPDGRASVMVAGEHLVLVLTAPGPDQAVDEAVRRVWRHATGA